MIVYFAVLIVFLLNFVSLVIFAECEHVIYITVVIQLGAIVLKTDRHSHFHENSKHNINLSRTAHEEIYDRCLASLPFQRQCFL